MEVATWEPKYNFWGDQKTREDYSGLQVGEADHNAFEIGKKSCGLFTALDMDRNGSACSAFSTGLCAC
jgi:hypothetical protein